MAHAGTSQTMMAPAAASASAAGLRGWPAVYQTQLRFAGRLMLLYRHAAVESRTARSPVELLAIQMNLQKAFVMDCTTFLTDILRVVSGLPARAERSDRTEAVAPVIGAITEPIMEGVQAAMLAAAPAAAFGGPSEPSDPEAGIRHPDARHRDAERPDAEPHGSARGSSATSSARRRPAASSRGGQDKKPQARRESERKQPRSRVRR